MPLRALPLLLATLAIAPAFAQTAQADSDKIVAAQRADIDALRGKLAALPAHCTLGSAHGMHGTWTNARRAEPASVPDGPLVTIFTFEEPFKAHAFHVALNAKGWHELDKVESRDVHGDWHLAWSGKHDAAPAGCDYVQFEQAFDGAARDVAALRFTLHRTLGSVTTAYVGVLKAD